MYSKHQDASSSVVGSSITSTNKKRPRVVVALSGGVDSSVAACLLLQRQRRTSSLLDRDKDATTIDVNPQLHTVNKADCNDGLLDMTGLYMSNWNALDEDSDSNEAMATTNSKKDHHRRKSQNNVNDDDDDNKRKAAGRITAPSNSTFCEASEQEYNDALSVAQHLSMPLHRVSFASEYWIQVFEPFVESISSILIGGEMYKNPHSMSIR